MTSPAALYFHPDQIEGEGRDLVGRRSAGEGFLKAWVRHGPTGELGVLTETPTHAAALEKALSARDMPRALRSHALSSGGDLSALGTIFFPTPGYSSAPWARLRHGPASASFVGLTHTVSTRRIVESLHDLLTQPVEPWDAVICTSRAVKSVMEKHFQAEADYLRHRYGAARVPLPQLPVIPLGIHTEDFAPRPGAREEMRARHAAPDGAIVVLTMGRLSIAEKANPLPLFLALQRLAEAGHDVHLWLTGWTDREAQEALHREGAAALAPGVTTTLVDGRNPQIRRDIWAGADIFTLPADSIQETFGLVPVEAMAAGLPVVMPDWDGFRDTVVHGETGLLVATRMAPPGAGAALGRRFAEGRDQYLQHLSLVQAQVQIDVPAYAEALAALAADPALRARMGAAARAHAAANLDWRAIIPRYLALADELGDRRAAAGPQPPRPSPLEGDPFALYAGYPSTTLRPETLVTPNGTPTEAQLEEIDRLSARLLYRRQTLPPARIAALCATLSAEGPMTVEALSRACDLALRPTIAAVLQLAKADLVRLPRPPLRDAGD
ncbi:glycosyltransferase family 4 protein [Pseudoroseicyclus tamaricis]|uniref:Glycosyltransferase family 4 protein n=1 Tax=Pseudoroseicyclus tamaricis TaxID=2705421 RepID=A0A6B2JXB0_9RHOB|nr:glycosyltransferase family 4 protein [Pseudoroseicyclus tamaricis]NDV02515.1 glycosyltransferase family 4 protein [Pseudoroseicyclus tamaricis]